MAKKPTTEKQQSGGTKWLAELPQRPVYYSNFVEIRLSVVDFRLRIAQMVDVRDGQLIAEPLATIFMSPAHAKAFSQLLQRHIATYEERFGAIPDPKEIDV